MANRATKAEESWFSLLLHSTEAQPLYDFLQITEVASSEVYGSVYTRERLTLLGHLFVLFAKAYLNNQSVVWKLDAKTRIALGRTLFSRASVEDRENFQSFGVWWLCNVSFTDLLREIVLYEPPTFLHSIELAALENKAFNVVGTPLQKAIAKSDVPTVRVFVEDALIVQSIRHTGRNATAYIDGISLFLNPTNIPDSRALEIARLFIVRGMALFTHTHNHRRQPLLFVFNGYLDRFRNMKMFSVLLENNRRARVEAPMSALLPITESDLRYYYNRDREAITRILLVGRKKEVGGVFHEYAFPLDLFKIIFEMVGLCFTPLIPSERKPRFLFHI